MSLRLVTFRLAVNEAKSAQNSLDLEWKARKFLVTFEHTSPCLSSGDQDFSFGQKGGQTSLYLDLFSGSGNLKLESPED